MANYAIVRTDLMSGSTDAALLTSVKYKVSGTPTAIENGNAVVVGALDTGEREVYVGSAPTATSPLSSIVVIATPEVMVDERKKNLNQFRNEAGDIARGYYLNSKNVFSVTAEAVTPISATAPAVGQLVELQADTKWKLVATATAGSTQVGTVIAIEGIYIVIRVA